MEKEKCSLTWIFTILQPKFKISISIEYTKVLDLNPVKNGPRNKVFDFFFFWSLYVLKDNNEIQVESLGHVSIDRCMTKPRKWPEIPSLALLRN